MENPKRFYCVIISYLLLRTGPISLVKTKKRMCSFCGRKIGTGPNSVELSEDGVVASLLLKRVKKKKNVNLWKLTERGVI